VTETWKVKRSGASASEQPCGAAPGRFGRPPSCLVLRSRWTDGLHGVPGQALARAAFAPIVDAATPVDAMTLPLGVLRRLLLLAVNVLGTSAVAC